MALQLSNNYAQRALPANTYGENNTSNTLCIAFRTPATIANGGIYTLYNSAANRYFGVRIATGNLEAGIRSSAGVPISLGAAAPNTVYRITVTKNTTGGVSARANGGAAVTGTVAVATLGYTNIGVGTYFNASLISTSNVEIAYARAYNRILSSAELDAFHAGDLASIADTGIIDAHNLISDLNSNASGTALTFVDPESDPPVFTSWDPFAAAQTVTNVNGGNPIKPGQAFTWSTSGFTPAVNTATLDGVSLSAVSAAGATNFPLTDEAKNPRPGNRTLTAGNGTVSADATVPVGIPDNHGMTALAGTLNFGDGSVIPPGSVAGDIILFPTSISGTPTNTEVDADGTGRTDPTMQTLWRIKGDTGYTQSYRLIGGVIPDEDLRKFAKPLTAKAMTAKTLTGRSL